MAHVFLWVSPQQPVPDPQFWWILQNWLYLPQFWSKKYVFGLVQKLMGRAIVTCNCTHDLHGLAIPLLFPSGSGYGFWRLNTVGKGPGYLGVHLCSALLLYINDSEVHSQSFLGHSWCSGHHSKAKKDHLQYQVPSCRLVQSLLY